MNEWRFGDPDYYNYKHNYKHNYKYNEPQPALFLNNITIITLEAWLRNYHKMKMP